MMVSIGQAVLQGLREAGSALGSLRFLNGINSLPPYEGIDRQASKT